MNFLKFDLGHVGARAFVDVTLRGVNSDVFVVDQTNFQRMRRGSSFDYVGGHYDRSPVRLQVPHQGHWIAVVMPVGGRVEASVSVRER